MVLPGLCCVFLKNTCSLLFSLCRITWRCVCVFLLTPKHTLVLQGSCCCCRLGCHVHSFIHLGCEEHPVLHAKWCESDRDPTLLVGKRGVTGTKRRERERERERGEVEGVEEVEGRRGVGGQSQGPGGPAQTSFLTPVFRPIFGLKPWTHGPALRSLIRK